MELDEPEVHFHVDEAMDYVDDLPDTTPAFPGWKEVVEYLQRRAPKCLKELEIESGLDTEHPPQWVQWTVRACFDDSCETIEDERTFIRLMAEVESEE